MKKNHRGEKEEIGMMMMIQENVDDGRHDDDDDDDLHTHTHTHTLLTLSSSSFDTKLLVDDYSRLFR